MYYAFFQLLRRFIIRRMRNNSLGLAWGSLGIEAVMEDFISEFGEL